MPAINVRLTEEELLSLRHRSEVEGRSIQLIAHDAITSETSRRAHQETVAAAAAEVIALSQDLLRRLADR